MKRGECKTPGGKLVGVNVELDGRGDVASCSIDGDFFVDGADEDTAQAVLTSLSRALKLGDDIEDALVSYPDIRLVGTDAGAITTAYRRAVASGDHTESSLSASGSSFGAKFQKRKSIDKMVSSNTGEANRWRRRFNALRPMVVADIPRDPAEQMAVDERWAREVAAGQRPATLRFWNWRGRAVIVGRFQSIRDEVDLEMVRKEGFSVVRRCTGGGAMFVEAGSVITYSLYAPHSFDAGVDVASSYRLCDQWLIDAMQGLGLDVGFTGLNDISSQYGKIGGAAQCRFPRHGAGQGSLLHHVTLSYDIDAEKMGRVLKSSGEKMSDKAVKSAVRRVDPLRRQTGMGAGEVTGRLFAAAGQALQLR